MLIFKALNL